MCLCIRKSSYELLCGRKWNYPVIFCMPYMDLISLLLQIFVISRCSKVPFRDTRSKEMHLIDRKRKIRHFRKILQEKTPTERMSHKNNLTLRFDNCEEFIKSDQPFIVFCIEITRHLWHKNPSSESKKSLCKSWFPLFLRGLPFFCKPFWVIIFKPMQVCLLT